MCNYGFIVLITLDKLILYSREIQNNLTIEHLFRQVFFSRNAYHFSPYNETIDVQSELLHMIVEDGGKICFVINLIVNTSVEMYVNVKVNGKRHYKKNTFPCIYDINNFKSFQK